MGGDINMAKIGEIMQNFIMSNHQRAIWFMKTMPFSFWERKGEKMALSVFHDSVKKSFAYQDFLKKNNINPSEINTINDFKEKLPTMTKQNYLNQYPLEKLAIGEIKKETFGLCFTSGSTGLPTALLISKKSLTPVINGVISFFHYLWDIRSPSISTLCINGFALGPWLASFLSNYVLGKEAENFNFTLVTTGGDPLTMIEVIEKIGRQYDQILIMGYSSVLKLFIEEAEKRKLNLEIYNIRILSAGESLSKNLKKYMLNKIDTEQKNFWKILDFFATTDASVIGFGTPLAEVVRQIIDQNRKLCFEIFGLREIQNLFQYNPAAIFLEEIDNKITVTKPGLIPLIRYQIGDLGKIVSFEKLKNILEKSGYKIDELLKEAGWYKGYFKWPFFTFLDRADDMIVIYSGAKIYPQNLFSLFEKKETKEIRSFKITTQEDINQNKRFLVYLELKPDLEFNSEELNDLEKKYQKLIHEELLKNNLDYKDAYHLNPELTYPLIKIFPYKKGPFEKDKSRPKVKLVI